jgi:hypothetical protein
MRHQFRPGRRCHSAPQATAARPVIALTVAVLATGCGTASPQNASGPPRGTIQTSAAGTPHTCRGAERRRPVARHGGRRMRDR